jgi:hypothetical protein
MIFERNIFLLLLVSFSSAFLPSITFAEPVQLIFDGVIQNDPEDPYANEPQSSITVVVEYDSEAVNSNPPGCCAKYGPVSIVITHDTETLSISNANFNVDSDPEHGWEGIQWVDDGSPWDGTLLGQPVSTLSINFGRSCTPGEPDCTFGYMSSDLPLAVNLDEWQYHNGTFHIVGEPDLEQERWLNLLVNVSDLDQDGVNTTDDSCPDTAEGAVVDANGCSIAQYCPADDFMKLGRQVACTSRTAEAFVQVGLISETEKGQILSALAKTKSNGH